MVLEHLENPKFSVVFFFFLLVFTDFTQLFLIQDLKEKPENPEGQIWLLDKL